MSFDAYMKQLRYIKDASCRYTCSCKRLCPVEELFFCMQKSCKAFLCKGCTQQVIDTYYCPSCLNSFFSSTAFQNKNRCQQCRKCPTCFCTLGHVTLPNGQFFFRCEYCKWRSDEIGLKGGSIKALFGQIRERDTEHEGEKKFHELIKVYGDIFKKARAFDRRSFHYDPDMVDDDSDMKEEEPAEPEVERDYDAASAANKCDVALEDKRKGLWRLPEESKDLSFPEHKEGDDFSLANVTSLEQRYADLAVLPGPTKDMWPHGESLQTKVGHKCPRCTRFVLKPKAGATKVTYDISLLAMLLFPRMTINVGFEALSAGKKTQVVIALKNPCQAAVLVSFAPLPEQPADEMSGSENEGDGSSGDGSDGGALETKKLTPEGPAISYGEGTQTADVKLPKGEFTLDEYNAVAEQQSLVAEKKKGEAKDQAGGDIAYKTLSKTGLNFFVTPKVDVGDVVFSFMVTVKPAVASPETTKFIPYESFSYQATVNLGPVSTDSCRL